jgi:hypothetical protein
MRCQVFHPHLSVGQVQGKAQIFRLVNELQAAWKPRQFVLFGVSLLWCGEPPDDLFPAAATVPLSAGKDGQAARTSATRPQDRQGLLEVAAHLDKLNRMVSGAPVHARRQREMSISASKAGRFPPAP